MDCLILKGTRGYVKLQGHTKKFHVMHCGRQLLKYLWSPDIHDLYNPLPLHVGWSLLVNWNQQNAKKKKWRFLLPKLNLMKLWIILCFSFPSLFYLLISMDTVALSTKCYLSKNWGITQAWVIGSLAPNTKSCQQIPKVILDVNPSFYLRP